MDSTRTILLGSNQRAYFLPLLKDLLATLPVNSNIFDIGAGNGTIIDLVLRDGIKGKSTVSFLEPNPSSIESYKKKN